MSVRRQRFAWCLFDFANSAFNTVVITFVFPQFFVRVLVGDATKGDVWWARAMALSGLLVALLAAPCGARADNRAGKRRWLIALTLLVVGTTAAVAFVVPDPALGRASDATLLWTLGLVVVANVAFELAFVFYNAFLPELAPPDRVGRLSGHGWAFGYVGGLACLALGLLLVGVGDVGPLVTTDAHWNVRATNLLVAAWFLVFALPMLLWVRDRPRPVAAAPAQPSVRAVLATLRELPQRPALLRFLLAHLVYNDALMALITLAGLYMAGTLGMATDEIMAMGIGLNVVAGIGAWGFGHVDDRVGPRAAVLWSLALLTAGAVFAIAVPTVAGFAFAAAAVGIGMGPNQAASRSLLVRLVEPGRQAEYFGLLSMSGKATVWLGPLLFALVREWTDSQRAAFVPLIAMFAVGFVLMWSVRVPPPPR